MSLGQAEGQQLELWLVADDLPEAPGSPFYRKLNQVLAAAHFDREVEALCAPYYAEGGRPSIPPGRYFRMLLVGYFEGIESQRGIAWRCADSLSLREFLGCPLNAEKPSDRKTPDQSSMTRIRDRLPLPVYEAVFVRILKIASERGILKGRTLLVDSTLLEANASMKGIVRKVSREGWNAYLQRLAEAEGIENPTPEDGRRIDRRRKGKKTSNADWESPVDPDARIAKLKDGRTHLAYKAEHAVDADSGLIVSAGIEHADGGEAADGETIKSRVVEAAAAQVLIGHEQSVEETVGDNGYHKTSTLHWLEGWEVRGYLAEKRERKRRKWADKPKGHQEAFYANRRRVKGKRGQALLRKRSELVERSFAHCCETGGGRRLHVRGIGKVRKRWWGQVMGYNFGVLLRALTGIGAPRSLQGGSAPRQAVTGLKQGLHDVAKGFLGGFQRLRGRFSGLLSFVPAIRRNFSHRVWEISKSALPAEAIAA